MELVSPSFSVADYIVFSAMLVFSACIGIYYRFAGGKQQTTREYLLADGNMSITPVAFSLMASFMSAVTLLGVSSENYLRGTQFVVINIAYIIGTPICAYLFLPVFFQKKYTSSFEYLQHRFNKITRLAASSVFICQLVLYMSIVLYAPALALSAVTGLPKWTSVISVGIVCTFYCTIGGMKAVLWTDVFQSFLMFSAVFAVIYKGTLDVGGFSKVWEIAKKGDRIQFLNFDPNPTVRHSVWSLVIGGIFTYVSIYGVNQAQIQRLLTVANMKSAQIALLLNWPITSILSVTTCLAGIVVYANFHDCDPLARAKLTSPDQILPYFVMVSLSEIPGLPGLFVAGLFSGALSTMSSAINSLAAVTLEDFIRPLLLKKASDKQVVLITKLLALGYGVLCILLTYVVDKLGGILQASLTIFNVVGGPMLGLYTLGMLCPCAKAKGSLVAFLTSLIACSWIGFGAIASGLKPENLNQSISGCFPLLDNNTVIPFLPNLFLNGTYLNQSSESSQFSTEVAQMTEATEDSKYIFPLYKLSYMWYAALGWLLTVAIGLVGSAISGEESVDPLLLTPIIRKYSKPPMKNEGVPMADWSDI